MHAPGPGREWEQSPSHRQNFRLTVAGEVCCEGVCQVGAQSLQGALAGGLVLCHKAEEGKLQGKGRQWR